MHKGIIETCKTKVSKEERKDKEQGRKSTQKAKVLLAFFLFFIIVLLSYKEAPLANAYCLCPDYLTSRQRVGRPENR